jgi:hypothetical protein
MFPNSPLLRKATILLMNVETSRAETTIVLQYNPDSLTRTLQVQGAGDGGDRSEALRLKGPAVETITLEAELDATDQLEFPEENRSAVEWGIHPQLAALEALVHPTVKQLEDNDSLAQLGTIEILPMDTLLTVFSWGEQRLLPVRITEFSVTEEAFDAQLNPIRAKLSLGMRVLTVDDVGIGHAAGKAFMANRRLQERLAKGVSWRAARVMVRRPS